MRAVYIIPEVGKNPRLTLMKSYLVVGLSEEFLRVINDAGEPILYPRSCFEFSEGEIPIDWVREEFPDGEFHIEPAETASIGFYERFFDGDQDAVDAFEALRQHLEEDSSNL